MTDGQGAHVSHSNSPKSLHETRGLGHCLATVPRRLAPMLALLSLSLAACPSPVRATLARVAPAADVDAVAVDATGVYAVAAGDPLAYHDGAILRVSPDGRDVVVVAADLNDPLHVALGAGHVWWLTEDGVHRASAGASPGAPEVVAPLDHPSALTVVDGAAIVGVDGAIVRVVPGAGDEPAVLVADAGAVTDLATDGASIYWTDAAGGRVVRADATGASVTVLATDQVGPVALAVADGAVAWVTAGDSSSDREATVATVPAAGGAVKVLARRGYGYEDVAISAGWVYWTWGDMFSSAHRVRLTGGGQQPLAEDQTDLDGIAVAGADVWIGGPDGVYRLTLR